MIVAKAHYSKIARAIVILVTAALACHALTFSETIPSSRLRISGRTVEQAQNIGRYVDTCSTVVDQLLQCRSQPEKTLAVVVVEPGAERTDADPLRIEYDENEGVMAVTYRLMRGLLTRRARELFDRSSGQTATIDWLAAALTNRVVMHGQGRLGAYEPDYQVARQQFSQRHFPRMEILLQGGVTPEAPALFQLYMLHADLLAACLAELPGQRGEIFRKMLEMEAFGRTPVEACAFLLSNNLRPGQALQGWYEQQVVQVSRRGRRVDVRESIEARVEALESIAVVGGNGPAAVQRIRLDELPDILRDYKLDKVALANLQQRFLEIRQDASPLLQPALDQYVAALRTLAGGHERRFRTEFQRARAMFAEALAQQRQIEQVVDRYEREYVPPQLHLDAYLDVVERYRRLNEQAFPRLE
ncbi:MAG: hypothetical protein GX574_04960 [Lentisphaerae bacterium]|nr:hypothetical protein [Lentisphaerota bacterium]OQC14787.1 MAG: hypothetical protein BWX73_01655 [Lentisphaerae bacterium ADurb.Bin082]